MSFKTYRASAEGFDGDKLRVEGEVFTTNIAQGSWMTELDEKGNAIVRPDHSPPPAKDKARADGDDAAIETLKKQLEAKSELLDSKLAELDAKIAELNAKLEAGEQTEPGPLDTSIAELATYLEGISDVGAIDALIAAETAGKTRSGALKVLDERKAALQGG